MHEALLAEQILGAALTEAGRVNPGMWEGRKRGVLFDGGKIVSAWKIELTS